MGQVFIINQVPKSIATILCRISLALLTAATVVLVFHHGREGLLLLLLNCGIEVSLFLFLLIVIILVVPLARASTVGSHAKHLVLALHDLDE